MQVLKETSRTYYIPITLLKRDLRLTVGSAYLCMRAIDEIEDHETMDSGVKETLLRKIKQILLQNTFDERSEEHTSELQSRGHLVCRLLLEKKQSIEITQKAS